MAGNRESGLRDFSHDEWLPFDQPAPGLLHQLRRQSPIRPTLVALALVVLATVAISPGRMSNAQGVAVTSSTANGPLLGFGPALAYDAKHRQVVLLNQAGQTWIWANRSWTLAHPADSPPTGLEVAAWDPAIGKVVLVGVVGEASEFTYSYTWDGTSWNLLHPGVIPPAGALSMAYDAATRELVLLVGLAGPSGTIAVQTWIFDGKGWEPRAGLDSSSLSVSTALGFDPSTRTMLAVSTNFSASGTSTWRWDGGHWDSLTTSHHPPPSARMTLVNQPGSGKLLLLTEADSPFGDPTVAQTWTWSGRDWEERTPLGDSNVIPYAVTAGDALHGDLWAFEEIAGATPSALRPLAAFRWGGGHWDRLTIDRVTR